MASAGFDKPRSTGSGLDPKKDFKLDIDFMGSAKWAVAFMILLLVASLFLSNQIKQDVPKTLTYAESQLHKNKNISIHPGDVFNYSIAFENQTATTSFEATGGQGCIWVSIPGTQAMSCLKQDGTDQGGSNVTFLDSSIFFFKPWMLALSDDWSWNISGCLGNTSCIAYLHYKVVRTDFENGKKYYVVRISSGDAAVYDWIEDDRRIVVKELGPGYNITMVSP